MSPGDELWVQPIAMDEGEPVEEQEPTPKLVTPVGGEATRQCTHVAQGDQGSEYLTEWRLKHYGKREGFVPANCSRQARVRVDGRPLCRRHAGMVLLEMCERKGI